MKYNYPANYLTKDGKIKKAYAKKAADFRKTHTQSGGLRCYMRKRKDGSIYRICSGGPSGRDAKKKGAAKKKNKSRAPKKVKVGGIEDKIFEQAGKGKNAYSGGKKSKKSLIQAETERFEKLYGKI